MWSFRMQISYAFFKFLRASNRFAVAASEVRGPFGSATLELELPTLELEEVTAVLRLALLSCLSSIAKLKTSLKNEEDTTDRDIFNTLE